MKKNGFSDLKCSCYQIMEFGTNNDNNNCSLFQLKFSNFEFV